MKAPKKIIESFEEEPRLKESLKVMQSLLEYGEVKTLAKKNGIDDQRAYNILNGRLKIVDSDEPFLMACLDRALPRKRRNEKLATLLS